MKKIWLVSLLCFLLFFIPTKCFADVVVLSETPISDSGILLIGIVLVLMLVGLIAAILYHLNRENKKEIIKKIIKNYVVVLAYLICFWFICSIVEFIVAYEIYDLFDILSIMFLASFLIVLALFSISIIYRVFRMNKNANICILIDCFLIIVQMIILYPFFLD